MFWRTILAVVGIMIILFDLSPIPHLSIYPGSDATLMPLLSISMFTMIYGGSELHGDAWEAWQQVKSLLVRLVTALAIGGFLTWASFLCRFYGQSINGTGLMVMFAANTLCLFGATFAATKLPVSYLLRMGRGISLRLAN